MSGRQKAKVKVRERSADGGELAVIVVVVVTVVVVVVVVGAGSGGGGGVDVGPLEGMRRRSAGSARPNLMANCRNHTAHTVRLQERAERG